MKNKCRNIEWEKILNKILEKKKEEKFGKNWDEWIQKSN